MKKFLATLAFAAMLVLARPVSTVAYSGTYHFWYPAIGINRPWQWYGCEHAGDPAGLGTWYVYRWGCAGAGNKFLMGHASGAFYPLRRAYHDGTLQVGQLAYFANWRGYVSTWKVEWIRRVSTIYLNATASSWATEASSTPIMTLMTCDGAFNEYRIIVRLDRA